MLRWRSTLRPLRRLLLRYTPLPAHRRERSPAPGGPPGQRPVGRHRARRLSARPSHRLARRDRLLRPGLPCSTWVRRRDAVRGGPECRQGIRRRAGQQRGRGHGSAARANQREQLGPGQAEQEDQCGGHAGHHDRGPDPRVVAAGPGQQGVGPSAVPTMVAGSAQAQRSDCRPRRQSATAPAPARAATAGAITTV